MAQNMRDIPFMPAIITTSRRNPLGREAKIRLGGVQTAGKRARLLNSLLGKAVVPRKLGFTELVIPTESEGDFPRRPREIWEGKVTRVFAHSRSFSLVFEEAPAPDAPSLLRVDASVNVTGEVSSIVFEEWDSHESGAAELWHSTVFPAFRGQIGPSVLQVESLTEPFDVLKEERSVRLLDYIIEAFLFRLRERGRQP